MNKKEIEEVEKYNNENKNIASEDSTNNGIVMWGRNGHCEICKKDSQNKGKHYHLRDCK